MSSTKSEPSKRKVVNADEAYLAMCMGAMAISHTSVLCRACGGHGFRELSLEDMAARLSAIAATDDAKAREQLRRDLSAETTCKVCAGIGSTSQRRADRASAMDSMWTTVRCGRCRGCGESMPPTDASAEREDKCWACGGAAYIVPVTVKERGSSRSGRAPRREAGDVGDYDSTAAPAYTYDPYLEDLIEDLVDRRRATRGLDAALATAPDLAVALGSYLGAEGDRWVNHPWGRAFSIWQHTEAGITLSAESVELSRGSGHLQDITTRLRAAREQRERGQLPNDRAGARIRNLLLTADHQARELLQRLEQALSGAQAAA